LNPENSTFSEYMNNLEKVNPVLFNNIVSGIAKTKKYLDENNITEINDLVKKDI